MVPPRFRPALAQAPLTQGFDLGARAARTDRGRTRGWWPASALLVRDPREATAADHRAASARSAVAEPWTPQRDLLASDGDATRFRRRGRERRPRAVCASATTSRAGGPIPAPSSRRPTASATARPATSAPRPSRTSSATTPARSTIGDAIPLPAAGGIEPEDIEAARRDAPRGVSHPGARRHRRPTTPQPPSAVPTCSVRRQPSAGPAAGTRCS